MSSSDLAVAVEVCEIINYSGYFSKKRFNSVHRFVLLPLAREKKNRGLPAGWVALGRVS